MKKTIVWLIALTVLAGQTAEAQRRGDGRRGEETRERFRRAAAPAPEIGIRGTYDFDRRDFGVGAQAHFPLMRAISLAPSGDLFFGEERTWQANADVALKLRFLRAGGGLAIVDGDFVGDADGDHELGLNLFAGVHAPPWSRSWARPYVEARWTFLEDDTPFRLAAGVNVRLGGGRR